MATNIEINTLPDKIEIHVTDSTGRDERAAVPRYPRQGSEKYVRMVDALDSIMYEYAITPA